MTTSDAIQWLHSIKGKYIHGGDGEFDKCRKEAIDYAIESMIAAEAGWISVKERLPERAGKYLVVSNTALAELPPQVKTAWFLNNLRDNSQFKYEGEPNKPGFYNGDGEGDWVERYVTHWMPLPEPPKEG